MTTPTDTLAAELAAGPLKCSTHEYPCARWTEDDPVKWTKDRWCAPCQLLPAVAAFIVERERPLWGRLRIRDQHIDALTAERDSLKAEVEKLRDALVQIKYCMGDDFGNGWNNPENVLGIALAALAAAGEGETT